MNMNTNSHHAVGNLISIWENKFIAYSELQSDLECFFFFYTMPNFSYLNSGPICIDTFYEDRYLDTEST